MGHITRKEYYPHSNIANFQYCPYSDTLFQKSDTKVIL